MKHVIGCLYLVTAFAGLYWAARVSLLGLYGVPISPWSFVLLAGALVLFVGAVLHWTPKFAWGEWLPLVGSLLLTSFFLPAGVGLVRGYFRSEVAGGPTLAARLSVAAVVLISLVVAIVGRITAWSDLRCRH